LPKYNAPDQSQTRLCVNPCCAIIFKSLRCRCSGDDCCNAAEPTVSTNSRTASRHFVPVYTTAPAQRARCSRERSRRIRGSRKCHPRCRTRSYAMHRPSWPPLNNSQAQPLRRRPGAWLPCWFCPPMHLGQYRVLSSHAEGDTDTASDGQPVPGVKGSGRRCCPGIGVFEEGALADLILVDGDPLPDLQVLAHPNRNLLVIMKNGTVYKSEPHTPGHSVTRVTVTTRVSAICLHKGLLQQVRRIGHTRSGQQRSQSTARPRCRADHRPRPGGCRPPAGQGPSRHCTGGADRPNRLGCTSSRWPIPIPEDVNTNFAGVYSYLRTNPM